MPTLKYFDPADGQYKKIGVPVGQAPVKVSGVFGTPPLEEAMYGTDSLRGDPIYLDSEGNLRGQSQLLGGLRHVNDSPSTYPVGQSICAMGQTDALANGWPGTGVVVTIRRTYTEAVVSQWYYQNLTSTTIAPIVQYRSGNAANNPMWGLWVPLVTPPPAPTPDTGWITMAGSYFDTDWDDYGAGYAAPAYRRIGNQVFGRGLVKTAVVRTGISTMFNLPVGFRPPTSEILSGTASGVLVTGAASTGTAHTHTATYQFPIRVDVTNAGNITVNCSGGHSLAVGGWVGLGSVRFFTD